MCGIGGWAGLFEGEFPVDTVREALRHRGPDAAGAHHWENGGRHCTIVHTRLAINDLSSAGDQPLTSEDGSVVLVFNGEIYNSPELRRVCEARGHVFRSRSDGEVIVHLWEDHGEAAFSRLNGIFAVALLDRRMGQLVLARDPVGVKPLFWSGHEGGLWFASELQALRAAGAPIGGLDTAALAQFLTFLWIPEPRTPFLNVHSLLPGELLSWRAGKFELSTYRNILAEARDGVPVSLATAKAQIGERLGAAVRRQLLADVPVGLMASGGVDSSLLWWAAGEHVARAYTIDWPDEGDSERLHEDTAAVQRLEDHFGTPVTYVPGAKIDLEALCSSGDLFADPAVDLTRLIARRAAEDGYKVLLSGQGGDELFAGYRRHLIGPTAARLRLGRPGKVAAELLARTPAGGTGMEYLVRVLRAAAGRDPLSSYMTLCSYSSAAERAATLGCTVAEVSDEVVWQRHRDVFEATPPTWSMLRRLRAVDTAVYLPGLGLAYADRAGMQYGVEVRVPWVDLELVSWALMLPDEALVQGRVGKWLTRGFASDTLPREVVNRPKRGFAAPTRIVSRSAKTVGSQGFRQASYFGLAAGLLRKWSDSQVSAFPT